MYVQDIFQGALLISVVLGLAAVLIASRLTKIHGALREIADKLGQGRP